VKLIYARDCLAPNGAALLEAVAARPLPPPALASPIDFPPLRGLYQACLDRLSIRERYPAPDWSIADRWVARELLETGAAPAPWLPRYYVTAVPAFHAGMPIPRTTCAGLSAPLRCFPARPSAARPTDPPARALCASVAGLGADWDTGFAYT
jgi:hypothetical protein